MQHRRQLYQARRRVLIEYYLFAMFSRSVVRPFVGALLLLYLAYQVQGAASPFVLDGSVQQQYYAHLGMNTGVLLALLALAQPGVWHPQRLTRRLTWGVVGLTMLLVLGSWFSTRNQYAVRLGPGTYELRNP